jgi:hypothetical protein
MEVGMKVTGIMILQMVMAIIDRLMAPIILETGSMTGSMGKVKKQPVTSQSTRANLRTDQRKVKALICSVMALDTLVNSKIICSMVMVLSLGKMESHTLENGPATNKVGTVNSHGRMAEFTLANFRRESNMDRVSLLGLIKMNKVNSKYMTVIGSWANNMD